MITRGIVIWTGILRRIDTIKFMAEQQQISPIDHPIHAVKAGWKMTARWKKIIINFTQRVIAIHKGIFWYVAGR